MRWATPTPTRKYTAGKQLRRAATEREVGEKKVWGGGFGEIGQAQRLLRKGEAVAPEKAGGREVSGTGRIEAIDARD